MPYNIIYDYNKSINFHFQNHVATNFVAILIGSLVAEQHSSLAHKWLARAVEVYDRSIEFMKLIDDGSLDEGVGYVGYTFRSLSQYVFLLQRHLGIDHTGHPWLRQHFNYIYHTTQPGLKVGYVLYWNGQNLFEHQLLGVYL